ncbi:MAG: PQQ-dependent dehydrogenase, methanol/ethanol family [Candidatus Rokuibacteriota bacterium]|nr:MAG: methanol dehydrogenase [Candidatus Rokubacteria bacterium 13_2_20CM_2_70_11]PYN33054.1 MAG: PQQ-dependent dehydrogenase, methanol/ethanol family [Candidatus Rokubacteria bacterium]
MRRSISVASILLVAVTFAIAYANPELIRLQTDDKQWVMPGKDYSASRFSTLTQITKENVKNLRPAWTFSTGTLRGHEGAPLVVGATMYVHTSFPNNVFALDLKGPDVGRIKWKYLPKQDPSVQAVACCDNVNRGLSYADGKIFLSQLDGHLVALDSATGREVWKAQNADPKVGATMTSAPHVMKDKVIVGVSGGEFGVRGHVTAYDIKTGQQAWRAYSMGPDEEVLLADDFNAANPHFGRQNQGVATWQGDQWKTGGGTTWGWYAFDPSLNLMYYGTGNPSTWNPSQRPGDNKWSMTIFARDVDTGKAKWAYQMTPWDAWDYDGVNEMILADLTVKGRPVKAVVHFDRNGFAYTLDRTNGTLLVAEKFDPDVNWATHIDKQTGRPVEVPAMRTQAGKNSQGVCPAALGTKDQQPAAYSPRTKLFYVPTNHVCMDYEPFEVKYTAGQPYVGATLRMFPGPGGHMGAFIAWDAANGKIVWSNKEQFSAWSGALVTVSDVAFYGTLEGYLKAVDARTGKELWKFKTPSGIIGNPMTYIGPDGKQYVAILSGVGGWAGIGLAAGLEGDTEGLGAVGAYKKLAEYTNLGGVLTVFSLP